MYEKYKLKVTWLDRQSVPQFIDVVNGHHESSLNSTNMLKSGQNVIYTHISKLIISQKLRNCVVKFNEIKCI